MRTVISLAFLLIVLGSQGEAVSGASVIELVNQVSVDSYRDFLQNDLFAYDGANRHYGYEHYLARQRILERFEGFGLVAGLEPFRYSSGLDHNVVGVLPGAIRPGETYIVGAHYDAIGGSPGAHDNASGVAGVLEAARVLSQHAFEATVIFIAFDREEQGLRGSAAYVDAHAHEDIRSMVNLDCICYQPAEFGDSDYARANLRYTVRTDLVDDLALAMESYAGLRCAIDFGGHSDHVRFSAEGFAAVLLRSIATDNPYIHTPLDSVDTPGNVNYEYATQLTSGVVGYLATQARLAPVWRSPDFNGDCKVDIQDLLILAEHWGQDDPSFDISPPPLGDGTVDIQDAEGLLHYWGWEIPGSGPEPY
ncbi:MAG: M28 family peptidase [Phycisphaerales bacterium]|nr:MAG: M28 family peptidase [Phycisphaerales bacterium]